MRKGCGYFLLGLLGIGIIGAYPQSSLILALVIAGGWGLNYLDKVANAPSKEEIAKRLEDKYKTGKKYEFICRDLIKQHCFSLAAERKKYLKADPYGKNIDNGWSWDFNFGTDKGMRYFYNEIVVPEIQKKMSECVPDWALKDEDIISTPFVWAEQCFEKEVLQSEDAYFWLEKIINQVCDEVEMNKSSSDLDSMDGVEYEQYCKEILEDVGWGVEDTPTTGDQGVDLIASIEDLRVCIQCKNFAKPVGNKAVQEIIAGTTYWNGTHSVVVAKSGFTKSAKELAKSAKVILMSEIELQDLENFI